MQDPFDPGRFLTAQAAILTTVLDELRSGRKRTHWMWFIFPQLAGLATSPTARHYALAGLAQARRYLAHPVLGPRLITCTALVNAVEGRSAHQIFATPDDLKFHSCITLFALADPAGQAFFDAMKKYFGGTPDHRTLALLAAAPARTCVPCDTVAEPPPG